MVVTSRFLLAEFQLKHLLGCASQPRQFQKALGSLPKNMTEAYNKTMERIERRSNTDKDLALRVLSWIYHGAALNLRPLRMDELCELLVVEGGDTALQSQYCSSSQSILDVCQGLAVYDESVKLYKEPLGFHNHCGSGVVRFAHLTVQEFIRGVEILPISELAKLCLTYLSFEEFDEGPCRDAESLQNRVYRIYQAGCYVAYCWGVYTRMTEGIQEVQEIALEFLMSENKRKSMIQMRSMSNMSLYTMGVGTGTVSHTIAETGLAVLARRLLERAVFECNVRHLPKPG
jgi:ankyrin repeat domain-containing protein 50